MSRLLRRAAGKNPQAKWSQGSSARNFITMRGAQRTPRTPSSFWQHHRDDISGSNALLIQHYPSKTRALSIPFALERGKHVPGGGCCQWHFCAREEGVISNRQCNTMPTHHWRRNRRVETEGEASQHAAKSDRDGSRKKKRGGTELNGGVEGCRSSPVSLLPIQNV